ncbi:hypothetical protein BAUCODRAFT_82563 [Baudoinia panamericana UAMH 10762]|uniref:Importin N-terminal domain-containing protein n=1 Tax=Baudoinia panamericana (strain UAMH 10762) TaxID=717646 RepID=M2NK13_BAUPA|nr:uncharacterized protein BAUCODRAFT_82563 [Baudoinia panamericana UAMH 10762]EMC99470.1 hypothetical protein BAUCODRAFT_82563 [Baudoinia panamericana UAMH 10762]
MPSFAIEVPGEANPLTEEQLVHTLGSAASSDQGQIRSATTQLERWERSEGYYKHLQSAYLDSRLPTELRYLAIIQLKNGIDKYWRKTATNAVSKADKAAIRSRQLDSCLNETDDRLALQNALVIAKIARFEYPHDWPELIPALTNIIRNASQIAPLQLVRALLTLLHIIKELATGRLQRSRQNLQAATPELVHVLGSLYSQTVLHWQPQLPHDLDESAIRLSLMTMKVLRRLVIVGYEHPHRHEEVVTVWEMTQQHLSKLLGMRSEIPASEVFDKLTLQLAKLHHTMSMEHPASFVLLPNSVDLARAYWTFVKTYGEQIGTGETVSIAVADGRIDTNGEPDEKGHAEKLSLRGLLILRACVQMVHYPAQAFKYRTAEDKEQKNQATELLRTELFSIAFVQEVFQSLVTRFFIFRAKDLREWEDEPEDWEKGEEHTGLAEAWAYEVRPCAEKLFLDLAINYKDILLQPLLQVFYEVAKPEHEDVMFKDSVYTAVGLAAPILHDSLDFDAFIRDVLVQEVQKQTAGYNIVRRRAAILLAQWISVKINERQLVFQIYNFLLDPDKELNDLVVRVTAGKQLHAVIDDWGTKAEELQPYVQSILRRLLALTIEVTYIDTRMELLNTVSVVVERMEHRISPHADMIMATLPTLWEKRTDDVLLKQAILSLLVRLLNAMKADSVPFHGIMWPIITATMKAGPEIDFFLLEDALDLWGTILVQTPRPASDEILNLMPEIFRVFEFGSEELRQALQITESYVVLAPANILHNTLPLLDQLRSLLDSLQSKAEANGMVCNIIELLIRSAQKLGGEGAVAEIAVSMTRSRLLQTLLVGLRGSWMAHCTTGPLAKEPPVDGIVETDYFAVLARLILGSLDGFSAAIRTASAGFSSDNVDVEGTMKWLLEEWFNHFENVGDPGRRKLMCLALTKLLATNQPFILLHLQSLMTVWTDIITELREGAEDTTGDSLVYASAAAEASSEGLEAPEDVRRRELTCSDEVHTVNLPEFVKFYLEQAVAAAGGSERFQREWLVNVDKEVVAAFTQLGII